MSEKKSDSSFCWEATIKPDGNPEETEVRWYRRDSEEKQWQFCGNGGPSWDELSEEAKRTLGRVYGFVLSSFRENERREATKQEVDPEE